MIKFIDLFAGIGGFHEAFKIFDAECVFASEIDKYARQTYLANHSIKNNFFNEDIRSISVDEIPDHDILCAGFPCQPFSQAGFKKGFHDGEKSERGNLFYCILDILEHKRPKAFILENVRHLLKHDDSKTFQVIYNGLINIGYEVFYKIIKASDFGLPQHRPRLFIIGFDKSYINVDNPFLFPNEIPLNISMSDILNGQCDKKIGYTLRVGGRGSKIDDRHNWDAYLLDDKVIKLNSTHGKKMMGFSENFVMPVSETQAMKQLGNSVCVNVVKHVAKEVISYIKENIKDNKMLLDKTFNKGEWSEIYTFFKLIAEQTLHFGSINEQSLEEKIIVLKVYNNSSNNIFEILEKSKVLIKDKEENIINEYNIPDLLPRNKIKEIFEYIQAGVGSSFKLNELDNLLNKFSIDKFKSSSSNKGDIKLDFKFNDINYLSQNLGIKSYIGSTPTLLNASSATNFIFQINNIDIIDIDSINLIEGKSKIKDRIKAIEKLGANIIFYKCENTIHEHNLRKVDSCMPEIIADILIRYYRGEASKIEFLVKEEQKICRFKDYLKAIMLGMFYTKQWDGNYTSNGAIIVKKDGELLLYHVIKDSILKDYLFNKTKLDTPSSTRHRFGKIYKENGKLYIKLNLQIRNL